MRLKTASLKMLNATALPVQPDALNNAIKHFTLGIGSPP